MKGVLKSTKYLKKFLNYFHEIKLILENKNLQENGINFNELLKNNFTKSRIVTMFLCVLDMFKNGNIDIIPQGYSFSIKKVSIL